MAGQNRIISESFVATGDLSGLQHHIMDFVAAGEYVSAAAARAGIGVLLNKPQAGEHATVALQGRVRVAAGQAITAGDYIISAASGWAAVQSFVTINAGSAGQFLQNRLVLGRALETVASGSVFAMELMPHNVLVNSA